MIPKGDGQNARIIYCVHSQNNIITFYNITQMIVTKESEKHKGQIMMDKIQESYTVFIVNIIISAFIILSRW